MIAVNTKLVQPKKMSKTESQIHVRAPDDLKNLLEQAAKKAGRSMNAEVVKRLEASFLGEEIPLTMDELDEACLEAAETYVIAADDESFVRLIGKRFTYRRK